MIYLRNPGSEIGNKRAVRVLRKSLKRPLKNHDSAQNIVAHGIILAALGWETER